MLPSTPLALALFADAILAVSPAPVMAPGAAASPDRLSHHSPNQAARHDSRQEQQPPGAYTPLVTPAPSDDDAATLRDQGFRQETYYACRTAPSGKEHCGWHVPVLKAQHGSAAVPGRATDTGIVAGVVVGLAGVFAIAMM